MGRGLRSEDLLLTKLYIWFTLMFDSPIYSSISETLASSASTLDVKSPLSSEIPSFKIPLFDELEWILMFGMLFDVVEPVALNKFSNIVQNIM